jgi:DNA-binding transcriptional LysR family regulator
MEKRVPTVIQMKHFCALVEAGSFAAAAERLNISQPALSRSIAAIEEEYQLKLAERRRRGIVLTDFGSEIHLSFQRVLADIKDLGRLAEGHRTLSIGDLRFGATRTFFANVVEPVLIDFATEYPGVTIEAREGLFYDLTSQLQAGRLDFAFTPAPPRNFQNIVDTRLGTKPMHIFAREGHPLMEQENVRIADLEGYQMIGMGILRQPQKIAQYLYRHFPSDRKLPDIVVPELNSLVGIAQQTDCIAFGWTATFADQIAAGKLVRLDVTDFHLDFSIHLLERRHHIRNRAAEDFIERLISHFKELPD